MDGVLQLVVLNITSWIGISSGAEHVYGNIILVDQKGKTLDNIEGFSVSTFGRTVKLEKILTEKECAEFDRKDRGVSYTRRFKLGEVKSARFNTIEEITKAGVEYYKNLELDVPFISLRKGDKFKETVIIE